MRDKFTMGLVWHNCATHPPKEKWNVNLYATDGRDVFKVVYDYRIGWSGLISNVMIPPGELHKYWWADLQQTINTSREFAEILNETEWLEEI